MRGRFFSVPAPPTTACAPPAAGLLFTVVLLRSSPRFCTPLLFNPLATDAGAILARRLSPSMRPYVARRREPEAASLSRSSRALRSSSPRQSTPLSDPLHGPWRLSQCPRHSSWFSSRMSRPHSVRVASSTFFSCSGVARHRTGLTSMYGVSPMLPSQSRWLQRLAWAISLSDRRRPPPARPAIGIPHHRRAGQVRNALRASTTTTPSPAST
mmetsp:Transcript_35230/g.111346  ORF Transcript_35230/g.111346 Transcript_35230/m.111346 type:complete len:212 (-) Transcript_35230:38-673(-)